MHMLMLPSPGGNAASDCTDKFKSPVEKLTKLHRVAEGGDTTEGEQSNARKILSSERAFCDQCWYQRVAVFNVGI